MKTILERIIKQTRSALLEEARWQAQMHRSDAAKHLRSVAEHPPEEMLRSVADMMVTVDDLSGLAEREALVDDGRPVDATGEPLEVGDLVRVEGELWVVEKIQRRAGQWQIIFDAEKWTWSLPEHWTWSLPERCTKITELTSEEYLPLARRTMDPEIKGKALLSFLRDGVLGEWGELQSAIKAGDREKILKECGDVLWYAEQLYDIVGRYGSYQPVDLSTVNDWLSLIERTKKEIWHGRKSGLLSGIADHAIVSVMMLAEDLGSSAYSVRAENIKKLMRRYPNGFVAGGGVR